MSTDLSGRLFERVGDHLVPADLAAQELLQSVEDGKNVLLDFKSPRSPNNHAHFFAILHKALDHLEGYPDEDTLLDSIKLACGHCRQVMLVDGTMVFVPKTIRFAAMPEEQFKRFKERAMFVLSNLLGFDAAMLAKVAKQDNMKAGQTRPAKERSHSYRARERASRAARATE